MERVLRGGDFAVTGELGPPKSAAHDVVQKKARELKGYVDAVNITDCQTAIVRMSSLAAGCIAQSEGVEPVIQMTCRDRNRIGMQSDILGAAALGLKNLLCLTGDHQKFGNHAGAKGVFDMDSVQLLGMMRDLRDKKQFQCGEALQSGEPRLFLGCAANPFAGPNVMFRAQRLGKKIANGADFVQTQIIYNVDRFTEFMKYYCEMGLHEKAFLLAGVTPPRSLGMARYMKKSVPGMDVPDAMISRMRDARDKEEEGINIAVDIINQVRELPGVAGVHIMAIEWEPAVAEIVKRAGLAQRPRFDDDRETLSVAAASTQTGPGSSGVSPAAERDNMIAQARREADEIVLAARRQATAEAAPVSVAQGSDYDDAGEHEMNEKDRRVALESVRLGLDSLKKAFGLSDDQMEALARFAAAEAVLQQEPLTVDRTMAPAKTAGEAPPVPSAAPAAAAQSDEAAAAEKARQEKEAVEAQKTEEAKRAADAEAARKAEEALQAAAAKKAEEDKQQRAAEEAKKQAAAEAAAQAAQEKKAVSQTAASPAVEDAILAGPVKPLTERASKVPSGHYTVRYSGAIREVAVGTNAKARVVGGVQSLPFYLFEGGMPHKPVIAMDVLDIRPEEWPETLMRHFDDVAGDPVAWARKCVNNYGADAVCISLVSTDPNGMNRPASEAAETAAAVVQGVDVPVIVWGCGNSEKDTETLRDLTARITDRKVCLAPLSDANYRSLGASAMAFGHQMVAASPIDVNLAKQLNILLENMGVSLDSVLMDPSIGALGYGIEYTYSVMERIRLAGLTQKDEKLQVPFICNLGREVWKAKECKLPSDAVLGDQETRGVMMEAITASCMLLCGGDLLIMRHPKSVSLTRSLINGMAA